VTGVEVAIAVVGAVCLCVFIFNVVPRIVFRFLREGLTKRVAEHCRPEEIVLSDLTAMSFGQESRGKTQLRGNGALVLTQTELLFLQAVTHRDLVIPLERVTATSFVRSHLGKFTAYRLVKIAFDLGAGPDSIACIVRNPDDVRAKIDQQRASAQRPG
jgi:hypothetical protein